MQFSGTRRSCGPQNNGAPVCVNVQLVSGDETEAAGTRPKQTERMQENTGSAAGLNTTVSEAVI